MTEITDKLAEIKRYFFALDWVRTADVFRVRMVSDVDSSGEIFQYPIADPEGIGEYAMIKLIGKETRGDYAASVFQLVPIELVRDTSLSAEALADILLPGLEDRYKQLIEEEGGEAEEAKLR